MRSLIEMSDSKSAREREDSKARIGFTISLFSLPFSPLSLSDTASVRSVDC